MKYIVWFSGWIDSTYTAWKLKNEGHEVFLVFLHNYWVLEQQKIDYLQNIAKKLDLKLEIIDICQDFRDMIIDDFVYYYKSWKTPNPCVFCNPLIKFKILEDVRQKYNFDKVVTWHYAKMVQIKGKNYIATAEDTKKEQSYMIYKIANKDFIQNIDFQLWTERKEDIRKVLQTLEIPVVSWESQDVCFIKDWDYKNFINNYATRQNREWDIVDTKWNVLWKHKWIIHYTIGQRKWLWINTKLYVLDIDVWNNTIIVWQEQDLYKSTIQIKDFFIKDELVINQNFEWEEVFAKIRYKSSIVKIKSIENLWDKIIITFTEKVKSSTKWQHCVFYKQIDGQNIVIWWWEIC